MHGLLNIVNHCWLWIGVYALGFVWFYAAYANRRVRAALSPAAGPLHVACNVTTSTMVFVVPVLVAATAQPRMGLPTLASLAPGAALIVVSLLVQVAARRQIGVLPGGPYPGLGSRGLVTSGVYGRVRHPIYLAFILWQAGLAIVLDGAAAMLFAVAYVLALLPLIVLEERDLLRRYGAEYEVYRKRTPMLVPRWKAG
jgi:protein-S-isoprenylcysteine O-methyltransferase Ste14